MQRKAATVSDWKTTPMPEAHAEFTFHRSFTQEQMERLRYGNVPQEMEDKWFWYYEDNKLYIHRSWTGICVYIVTFASDDELRVLVNRDPEQYGSTDAQWDEQNLNQLLTWWTQPDYTPYNQFLADTYAQISTDGRLDDQQILVNYLADTFAAVHSLLSEIEKPTVQEKQKGCLYGGAAGDALGYAVEFLSLDQIRAKYGSDGIQYYELKDGRARFSDDTQMSLFTLEGICQWQNSAAVGVTLNDCLFNAYRDWWNAQEADTPSKKGYVPHTRLYQMFAVPRRTGRSVGYMRSLRCGRMGSIENPINNSKGNGCVMRVAPIGCYFSRDTFSMEQVMQMGADSAAITHGHPLAYISAAMLTGLINECVYGEQDTLEGAVIYAIGTTVRMFMSHREVYELRDLVANAVDLARNTGDALTDIHKLGEGIFAESVVAIAIYCALRYSNSFDEAIRTAANINGDSDTVAAVTGNILGAWKGIKCIDQKWIEPLHLDEYLKVLEVYS